MHPLPPPDPDAQRVAEILDGFRISKAVFTAVSVGLFDRLHEGPASCAELARHFGCAEHAFERLLGACAGLKLIAFENGRARNLPIAERYLRKQSPETLSGYILYSDRILFRLWEHLGDALREGTNRWQAVFGGSEGIFDFFFRSEKDKECFLAGMHGQGLLSSPGTVAAFDLSRFRHLVDLGGATGHLPIAACARYPELRATVFDLPKVIPSAARTIAAAGLSHRIATAAGDFFKDPLPQADLYGMGRILHDWSDAQVRFLLKKVCEHLPRGGGLLICEKILDEDKSGPTSAMLQSLNMLVCTEGRERSASEYEALAREAGFSSFQSRRTGRGVDAILALR